MHETSLPFLTTVLKHATLFSQIQFISSPDIFTSFRRLLDRKKKFLVGMKAYNISEYLSGQELSEFLNLGLLQIQSHFILKVIICCRTLGADSTIRH